MKIEFRVYEEKLFSILLGEQPQANFLKLINELSAGGALKEEIYDLFLEFQAVILLDDRTKGSENMYTLLTNFMDGFTSWAKGQRILPDEADV